MDRKVTAAIVCLVVLTPTAAGLWWHQGRQGDAPAGGQDGPPTNAAGLEGNLILGRPTDRSMTANVLATKGMEAFIEFGTRTGAYTNRTGTVASADGSPIVITMDGLSPDTQYYYVLRARQAGEAGFAASPEHAFHTQRARGSSFTFVVEADPHLDENTDPDLYNVTLGNMLADRPDLMFDLGDTFMVEKLPVKDRAHVEARYLLLREFLNRTCGDVPLLLVQGNHDGEQGGESAAGPDSLASMSAGFRKEYYPNPDSASSYYAFEWGDALFVVLDPYWFSPERPGRTADNWDRTLGRAQYDWFRSTLENSTARFKFVFCHQLVGGADGNGRGGAEAAPYYEMGGEDADGSWGFDAHRPGWGEPLHQLMVDNGVTVFFHGHDHFFARQELDGVVYQLCPQPGHPGDGKAGQAVEYGYVAGDILPPSGHIRVTVSEAGATVEYVGAHLPGEQGAGHVNGAVAFSYSFP